MAKHVVTKLVGPQHRDLRALRDACMALEKSTSRRMLLANIAFITDKYVAHGWEPEGGWEAQP